MAGGLALVLGTCAALVGPPAAAPPAVALIIDDLGYRLHDSLAALALDGPVAYAILPGSPHATALAEAAHARHKQVLVHLPMEANRHDRLLGPDAIRMSMNEAQIALTLARALASVPHAIGISNHMGSRLTADLGQMRRVMTAVRAATGLVFIDSRTTAASVAADAARETRVPFRARDVFLDHRRAPADIRRQLRVLVAKARRHGTALAIAHPHAETLAVLARWEPRASGVELVGVTELIRREQAPPRSAPSLTVARPECGDQGADPETAHDPDS